MIIEFTLEETPDCWQPLNWDINLDMEHFTLLNEIQIGLKIYTDHPDYSKECRRVKKLKVTCDNEDVYLTNDYGTELLTKVKKNEGS